LRFLIVHPGPQFSVHDCYVGWTEALRELGQQVVGYGLHDRLCFFDNAYMRIDEGKFRKALTAEQAIQLSTDGLYSDLYTLRPHVLLVVSAFLVPTKLLDLARLSGTKVVVLHTEEPYELNRELDVAAHADLNLLNDPIHIEKFRGVARAEYMPHAYRKSLHKPGPFDPDAASDFCWVGTAFESRIEFFEAMNLDDVDVALAGNWQRLTEGHRLRKYLAHDIGECCDNTEAVRLYQSGKVGLNLYRREAEDGGSAAGWAMGPREVEMAACGLFYLRDPRPEGDELLPMLPTFDGPEDASEQLRFWLDHDDERDEAARQAREAVADRTFKKNAETLLRLLER
jgi:spore maturation protein CgeB